VIEGDNVTLRCQVVGIPEDEDEAVLWTQKNGGLIGRDRELKRMFMLYFVIFCSM